MSFLWTVEQISALAPDGSSISAAKKLIQPAKWSQLGSDDRAVWGACKGSGKNPYLTRVALDGPAYKCSCPSRKFPCKHALALLYLRAERPAEFPKTTQPDWVSEWIAAREKRAEKKAPAKKKPATEKSIETKQKKRLLKLQPGLEELALRLKDVIIEGLAALPSKEYQYWDTAARRLVDSGAGALAREAAQLGGISSANSAWAADALFQLGRLALTVDAGRRYDALFPETQADLHAVFGWSLTREEVALLGEAVSDTWQVIGVVQEQNDVDRLILQRAWLLGERSNRFGLVLSFAPMGQAIADPVLPGATFEGELVFYPGSHPQRAMIKTREALSPLMEIDAGYENLNEALSACGEAMAKNLWLLRFPMLLKNMVITRDKNQWVAVDCDHQAVPLSPDHTRLFRIMAMAGGRPSTLFGEWENGRLTLIPIGTLLESPLPSPRPPSDALTLLSHHVMLGPLKALPDGLPLGRSVLELIHRFDAQDTAWRSLLMAGAVGAWESAGREAGAFAGALPTPCESEVRPFASEAVCRMLAMALVGETSQLIPEILQLMMQRDVRVQPWVLPPLLAYGDTAVDERGAIVATAGRRGVWLGPYKSEWRWISRYRTDNIETKHPSSSVWETGSCADRVGYLKALRKRDPNKGRGLLEKESFKKEAARERNSFVSVLETGLSMADEPFLEQCLDDRSKLVQQSAARLLASLSDSRLSGRMGDRLTRCISLKRGVMGRSLVVVPPETATDAAIRDGLAAAVPGDIKMGQRSYWLLQIIACAPLRFWTTVVAKNVDDVIRRVRKSDYESVILRGLWQAAVLQKNETWLLALCAQETLKLTPEQIAAELPNLNQPTREALVRQQLVDRQLTSDAVTALCSMIAECPAPWSPTFGREIIYWLRSVLGRYRNRNELNWTVGESLRMIAYLLPLDAVQEGLALAEAGTEQTAQFLERKENFYAVLMKRAVLKKELVDHG